MFFKRCNLRIVLLVYICKGYVPLIGFTQGRGTVWKISPVKTKDCDRPAQTPLVSCDILVYLNGKQAAGSVRRVEHGFVYDRWLWQQKWTR